MKSKDTIMRQEQHIYNPMLKGHNTQYSGHMGQFCQNELMVEIYSKGLVRAIGKVSLMKLSQNTN